VAENMRYVQIKNVSSGLALDISQGSEPKPVTQRTSDPNADSQRWNITVVDGSDNLCLLENARNDQVLAPGPGPDDWNIVFQPKGETPKRQWRLAPLGENVYYIQNPYSSPVRVLEVDGSSKDVGALIAQYQKNQPATANQQWNITPSSSPYLPYYIQTGGSGWAWGRDSRGQLGIASTGDQPRPVEVDFPRSVTAKAIAVAAGYEHSLAMLDDGSVWAWGRGENGRLGNGQTGDQSTPVEVDFPRSVTAKAIAVAAGWDHSLAALDDGSVWAWGYGGQGRLGNGQAVDQSRPVEVDFPRSVTAKAIAVDGGWMYSLAALDDGSVWAWGGGGEGELGNGQTGDQSTPVEVDFPRSVTANAIAVAAGGYHSLALLDDGSVWAWGGGGQGQLGNGQQANQSTPVEVDFPRSVTANAIAVAAGWLHSLAALGDGSVWAWGDRSYGQLGIGQTTVDQSRPVEVDFPRSVTAKALAVAAGSWHSLALLDDGSIWAWGRGENGRLGNGQTDDQSKPVQVVDLLRGKEAIAVAAGEFHSLACDGVLWH